MFGDDPTLYNCVKNLGAPFWKKIGGLKHQNVGQISDNFATWSRIAYLRKKQDIVER